jgi:hypothetical protein
MGLDQSYLGEEYSANFVLQSVVRHVTGNDKAGYPCSVPVTVGQARRADGIIRAIVGGTRAGDDDAESLAEHIRHGVSAGDYHRYDAENALALTWHVVDDAVRSAFAAAWSTAADHAIAAAFPESDGLTLDGVFYATAHTRMLTLDERTLVDDARAHGLCRLAFASVFTAELACNGITATDSEVESYYWLARLRLAGYDYPQEGEWPFTDDADPRYPLAAKARARVRGIITAHHDDGWDILRLRDHDHHVLQYSEY